MTPRTFCRWTATIHFQSGLTVTLTEDSPQRFPDMYETAGEDIQDACYRRAKATTGDDHPVSIDLHVHTFETECTE